MADIYTFYDPEEILMRRFQTPPSYSGVPRHYNPYDPEERFSDWGSKPGPPSPTFASTYIPSRDYSPTLDPESCFFGRSSPSSAEPAEPQDPKLLDDDGFDDQCPAFPLTSENHHLYGFSQTYPGDHTKYVPFDPESFFFGPKFDSCDPARDPKQLDVSFDDQSPTKVDPFDPETSVWDDYSPSYQGDENFDAGNFLSFGGLPDKSELCYPKMYPRNLKLLVDRFDNKFVNNSKGKLTNVESSGTAANKWNKKESSSASKVAWNTPAEEETWESVGEELRCKTGYFARKCSLGADGSKSGGHGCGSIGRAPCTRML